MEGKSQSSALTEGHIPSNEAIELTRTLIGFNTVSRESNLGLIEWIRDYLKGFGIDCRLTRNAAGGKANLFATIGDVTRPGLVLSGHTDVVPVDGEQWDGDPFRAEVRDGRLYGRGSADMKSFIGVVLASIPDMLKTAQSTFHLAFSYDEEVGCVGVRGLLADLYEQGIRPAGCIVGEPTDMQLVVAHKGRHEYQCRVYGKEAHSSLVPEGVNAIEYAARIIVFICNLAERQVILERHDHAFDVPHTTLQTGIIIGGTAPNVVPQECRFSIEMRYLPWTSPESLLKEVEEYARTHIEPSMQAVCKNARVEFSLVNETPGLQPQDDSTFTEWVARLTDSRRKLRVAYNTEAGLFQRAGIPTVICGPGSIKQAHQPNEFISLDQMALCEDFLRRLFHMGLETQDGTRVA